MRNQTVTCKLAANREKDKTGSSTKIKTEDRQVKEGKERRKKTLALAQAKTTPHSIVRVSSPIDRLTRLHSLPSPPLYSCLLQPSRVMRQQRNLTTRSTIQAGMQANESCRKEGDSYILSCSHFPPPACVPLFSPQPLSLRTTLEA
mmetsp:Transcript_56131/g.109890  ORF Transcript_56131/g.109890 Transcript_56131/m.109890 type:complete len:146 (-) Transcript_56131:214-651(-)